MKVLCIGHATYDVFLPVENYPIENSKIKLDKESKRIEAGGGPTATAAYLLSRWGIDTTFAGTVGDDYYGKKIRDEFRTAGVNTNFLELNKENSTSISYIISNKLNGSRTILNYDDKYLKLNNNNIDIDHNIVLLDGYEYEASINAINKNSISIIDAEKFSYNVIELCKKCDYIICSKDFAEKATNIVILNDSTLESSLDKLNMMFKGFVIITLGEDGCAYKQDRLNVIKSFAVNTVDTTGAGDIFHGAFIYGLIQKWDLNKILRFSNLASSMSVNTLGVRNSIFDVKQVEEALNESQ